MPHVSQVDDSFTVAACLSVFSCYEKTVSPEEPAAVV